MRVRRIRARVANRPENWELERNFPDEEVYQTHIGDPRCRFNAHSSYLRCAVNPSGPCETCPHYQPKE